MSHGDGRNEVPRWIRLMRTCFAFMLYKNKYRNLVIKLVLRAVVLQRGDDEQLLVRDARAQPLHRAQRFRFCHLPPPAAPLTCSNKLPIIQLNRLAQKQYIVPRLLLPNLVDILSYLQVFRSLKIPKVLPYASIDSSYQNDLLAIDVDSSRSTIDRVW